MKLTVNQVYEALRHLTKNNQTGHRPPLLEAKGDTAIAVYYLKNELKDAFKPLLERGDDLLNERSELVSKRQKEASKGNPHKDKIEALDIKIKGINEELTELGQTEEELTLSQGKLNIGDIKGLVTAETLHALDFAIEFKPNPKDNE